MTDYAKGRADILREIIELANKAAERQQVICDRHYEDGNLISATEALTAKCAVLDLKDEIKALAQQPQSDIGMTISEPKRECGTCNSWIGSHCVDLEFPIRDCINDSYSEWQPKEGA